MPLPLAVPIGIAIGQGLLGLFGAKKSSDASKKAAATQEAAAKRAAALYERATSQANAYGQQMFDRTQQWQQPYMGAGNAAMGQLQQMMGLGGGGGQMPMNMGRPPQGPQGPPGMGSMMTVQMQGPDGSMRAVPQSDVQRALKMGARVVNSGGGGVGMAAQPGQAY